MKMRAFLKLAGAVVLMQGVTTGVASAASLTIVELNGRQQVIGATGVDVGGEIYSVSFKNGSCVDNFDGCDSPTDFAFDTRDEALEAAEAFRNQVAPLFFNEFVFPIPNADVPSAARTRIEESGSPPFPPLNIQATTPYDAGTGSYAATINSAWQIFAIGAADNCCDIIDSSVGGEFGNWLDKSVSWSDGGVADLFLDGVRYEYTFDLGLYLDWRPDVPPLPPVFDPFGPPVSVELGPSFSYMGESIPFDNGAFFARHGFTGFQPAAVPLPAGVWLLLSGFAVLVGLRSRINRHA